MVDFSQRSAEAEMMDDFALGSEVINPIMDELEVINKLLGGYRVFYDAFERLNLQNGMTVSDWGCGGGDAMRALAGWARKKNLRLKFIGVDATESALTYARSKSASYPEISYIHADVLSDQLKVNQFDVVISSLFTHHFQDVHWIKLIQKMSACAASHVVVNDLHRHWFAYYSIGVLTNIFSKSDMVKHDSKVSVLRSFTRPEIIDLMRRSGLINYELKWKWAFRWQLIIHTGNSVNKEPLS